MIVPQPLHVESLPGSFKLPNLLVVAHGDDGSAAEAMLLVDHLQQRLGFSASAQVLEVSLPCGHTRRRVIAICTLHAVSSGANVLQMLEPL